MNAPATITHLQAIGADIRDCCNALDDAESVRNFLRNLYDSLPVEVLAWHCYAEDRIVMTPQYRALSDEAKRAVQYGFVPTARLVCRAGLPIALADLRAAEDFLRQCRDAVIESDDVWETAENSRNELLAVIAEREEEEEAIAEWRVARHERDSTWMSFGIWGE